jgi:hypothetical protein
MKRTADEHDWGRCLSLVCNPGTLLKTGKQERSLNIQAPDVEVYRTLVLGFKLLKAENLYKFKSRKPAALTDVKDAPEADKEEGDSD